MKQLVLEISPPADPTFANFVTGRNREAVDALLNAARSASTSARVIYLWGFAGCGKTHLLRAFGLACGSALPENPARLCYVPVLGQQATHVLVDNVQSLDDAQQVSLFDAINQRALDPAATVVVTGNVAPRDLAVRPELSSRLGSGLVFALHPLNDAEKMQALDAHASSRGFCLRDDVVSYLLRHARRDMASLIGILDALDQYSLETGREITLPLLKQMAQPELLEGDGD
ncbi:MAG: DnaA regulatory inactivator Hda [Burkholderiales bacterium]|nr:DnaA regulatory inactivator Hda [Rhodocyclaceae bacterium]